MLSLKEIQQILAENGITAILVENGNSIYYGMIGRNSSIHTFVSKRDEKIFLFSFQAAKPEPFMVLEIQSPEQLIQQIREFQEEINGKGIAV